MTWIIEGISLMIAAFHVPTHLEGLDLALGYSWLSVIPGALAWVSASMALKGNTDTDQYLNAADINGVE